MQFHVGGAERFLWSRILWCGNRFPLDDDDSRTDGRNNNASEGDTANIAAKKVGDVQWDDFNATV